MRAILLFSFVQVFTYSTVHLSKPLPHHKKKITLHDHRNPERGIMHINLNLLCQKYAIYIDSLTQKSQRSVRLWGNSNVSCLVVGCIISISTQHNFVAVYQYLFFIFVFDIQVMLEYKREINRNQLLHISSLFLECLRACLLH